jgi:dTDP-4-amino-4,6-dideoxygalactose transaminase
VLSVKLKHLDEWNDLRRARAKEYAAALASTSLQLPHAHPGYGHIFHLYVVETDERDDLQAYLEARGIVALTHYPIAIHQQEGYPWGRSARIAGTLKHTERSAARVLSLPLYPELSTEETERVIQAVVEWDQKSASRKPESMSAGR